MSKQDILEAIASMSVLELSELISEMEEKFGVSAAAAAVAVAAPGGGGDAGGGAEEKDEFDIVLTGFGDNKVAVIKACLLYTSPSPRDGLLSRMPSSA